MALTLNTNSYVTVAEATAYFDDRVDSLTWFQQSSQTQEQALITATQLIDENYWIGYAVSPSQALAWPRLGATYFDKKMGQSITPADDEVPTRVKIAVYEQAFHLINNEDLQQQKTQTFESISVGSISLSDSNSDVTRVSIITDNSVKHIRPLLANGGTSTWWRAN